MAKDTDPIGAMTFAELRAFILQVMNVAVTSPPEVGIPAPLPEDPEKFKLPKLPGDVIDINPKKP